MEQLRIYTLSDKETAEFYFTANWAKHRISLPGFGFEIKGVWIGNTPGVANQVIALISFPDHADVDEMARHYLKSPEFAADTEGFDRNKIIQIETKVLRSAN